MSANTNLQNAFKYLAARLKGPLGNKLLSLRYQNNYLRVYSNTYEGICTTSSNSYSPVSLAIASDAVIRSFHAGILNITNEQYSKYLFLVNLLTTNNQTSTASFQFYGSGCDALYGAGTSYKNISLADLESSNIYSVSNGVSSTITMNNSEGKLFKVAPSIKIGGTITANETVNTTDTLKGDLAIASGATLTISGTYNVRNNITVNSGGTLYVNPGATLKFLNNAGLDVYGTLTANGTSSQRLAFIFSGNSGGIFISSSGSANINYSDISNAYYGVRCQGQLNSFSYNTVTNNITGLFVENTDINPINYCTISSNSSNGISAVNTSFGIDYNFIRDNGSKGISGNTSSQLFIENNSITGNSSYGIQVMNNSEAFIAYASGKTNLITDNRYGVYTNQSSVSYLNYNCLYDNNKNSTPSNPGYEVIVTNLSSVEAGQNWWGDTIVNPNRLYIGPGTTIYYGDPLKSTICGGMSKSNAAGNKVEQGTNSTGYKFGIIPPTSSFLKDKELDSAAQLRYAKKFEQAISIYTKIIISEGSTVKAGLALTAMSNCYRESKKTGFIDYLVKSVRTKISEKDILYAATLELENNWLVFEKRYSDILKNLEKLKSNYPDSPEIIKNAIFQTGYVYLTFFNDTARAKKEFDLLASKYPDDDLVYTSMEMLGTLKNLVGKNGEGNNSNSKTEKNQVPTDYSLEQNYPNPFNPTTTINYSVPVDSKVKLTIYNNLGQVVRVLVDEIRTAGNYSEVFIAGKLASGVYFYSLTAQSLDGIKKDFQSNKKMLLIK